MQPIKLFKIFLSLFSKSWRLGWPHRLEGNPKAREEVKIGDQEGEESTMMACGDGEAAVVRTNGKAACKVRSI
jgi:hypothetical protein